MRKNPKERFSETASRYHRFRPSYPNELIDWILKTAGLQPPACVVDVGCGTGISSRLFAQRGFSVIGVDPNDDMLAFARVEGGARYVKGEAAATGLQSKTVRMVVAGQSMHWFELGPTLAEWRRIAKPGAWGAAFWNDRARSRFLDEYDALLKKHSREYPEMRTPAQVLDELRRIVPVRDAEFTHRQFLNREGFIGRVYSSSYVIHGVDDRARFDAELHGMFDRHQSEGQVEFAYRTPAGAWPLAETR